jgi:hypothetical protein
MWLWAATETLVVERERENRFVIVEKERECSTSLKPALVIL